MVMTIDGRLKNIEKILNDGSGNTFDHVPRDLTILSNESSGPSTPFHIDTTKIPNYEQIHKSSATEVNNLLIEQLGEKHKPNIPLWLQVNQQKQNITYLKNKKFEQYLRSVGLSCLYEVTSETATKLLSASDLFEINRNITSFKQEGNNLELTVEPIARHSIYVAISLTDVFKNKKTPETDKKVLKKAFERVDLKYFSFSSAVNLNDNDGGESYWVNGIRNSSLGKDMLHSPAAGMISHDFNLSNLPENLIKYEISRELGLTEKNFDKEKVIPLAIISSRINKHISNLEIIYDLPINVSPQDLKSFWKNNTHEDKHEHSKIVVFPISKIKSTLKNSDISWVNKKEGSKHQFLPLAAGAGAVLYKKFFEKSLH